MSAVGALAAVVAGLFFGGCTPIPRARTLPPTIRSVYIPMFTNDTSEPAIEELATRVTQQEFLADGRLRLDQRKRADAWVECRITEFNHTPASLEVDDFPAFNTMSIRVAVTVRENLPTAPPLGGVRNVTAQFTYPSDLRRSVAVLDVEASHRLMEDLARQIVREVITGEYGERTYVTTSPPPAVEEALPESLD
jgi:hypothetical protein